MKNIEKKENWPENKNFASLHAPERERILNDLFTPMDIMRAHFYFEWSANDRALWLKCWNNITTVEIKVTLLNDDDVQVNNTKCVYKFKREDISLFEVFYKIVSLANH